MTCASSDLEPTTGKEVGDAVHAALAIGCRRTKSKDEVGDGEDWSIRQDPDIPAICEINRVKEKDVRPLYKRGLKAFRTV
jgi:hypothetical protein